MPAHKSPARRPTIDDVARAAQVSKGAVSFALNGRPGVAKTTRARILAAADELGWRPSASGRSLSTQRALAVGLVVAREPELLGADPFFPPFIAGIETVLARRGHALVLQVPPSADAELDGYRRLAADRRVDGVFLSDLRVDDPRPRALAELGLPAVTIGRMPNSQLPSVSLDDRPGIEAAVRHLIELGHRRIANVAGPPHFVHGDARRAAWRKVMRAAGLAADLTLTADFTASGGAAATTTLLDLAEPPTAIVYANDVMAIAGMSVAASRGVSVPAQLSVTGFDDTELARHLSPALTTVRSDALGWGAAAAQLLLDVIEVAARGPARLERSAKRSLVIHVELPPAELILRDSCAPPPTSRSNAARRRTTPSSTSRLSISRSSPNPPFAHCTESEKP
jgi:DNA-binding LacI/PurR family transcriptional regulator